MDKIIVTLLGGGLIVGIYLFFFQKREEIVGTQDGLVKIKVSGGYKPGIIKTKAKSILNLEITRTDNNTCLEEIVIPDFGIKEFLPLNKPVNISLTPEHKGEYDIHCGMNMFHAKLIVV